MSWSGGHNEIICYNASLTTNAYFRLVASTSRFVSTQVGQRTPHFPQDAHTHTSHLMHTRGPFPRPQVNSFFGHSHNFLPPILLSSCDALCSFDIHMSCVFFFSSCYFFLFFSLHVLVLSRLDIVLCCVLPSFLLPGVVFLIRNVTLIKASCRARGGSAVSRGPEKLKMRLGAF